MSVNCISSVSFCGYQSILKSEWKAGHLPTVKRGLYGDTLTIKNCSLEHCKAKSKGGKSVLSNYALASKYNNTKRGNGDIHLHLTIKMIREYLMQFIGIKTKKGFNGNEYIKMLTKTFENLGFDFNSSH